MSMRIFEGPAAIQPEHLKREAEAVAYSLNGEQEYLYHNFRVKWVAWSPLGILRVTATRWISRLGTDGIENLTYYDFTVANITLRHDAQDRQILSVSYEVDDAFALALLSRLGLTPTNHPEQLEGSAAPAKIPLPDTAPLPGIDGYTWDDTFDWFFRIPRYVCPNVGDLMTMVGRPERTFYRQKDWYEQQYGERPMPDDQSKFG